jgi:hypothetical protein
MIAILRGHGRTAFLAVAGGEAAEIVDLLHVASLTVGGDGKGRRKKAG